MLARIWSNRNFYSLLVGMQKGTVINSKQLLYNPTIMLLDSYLNELKTYNLKIHTEPCIQMLSKLGRRLSSPSSTMPPIAAKFSSFWDRPL